MSANCTLCGGHCAGAELAPLLDSRLRWLWEQVARAADRRGDASLAEGSLSLRAPASAEERAAARGLVGARVLKSGQSRNLDLGQLTEKLRVRGPHLTPGVVAAHALGRRLALRAEAHAQRRREEEQLMEQFRREAESLQADGFRDPDRVWTVLRRTGWAARLLLIDQPQRFVRWAGAVLRALPSEGARIDRRRLAADATGDPHALDHGSTLSRFVLAILMAAGRIEAGQRPRDAWMAVGVDADDVVGGLTAVGIAPVGWNVPRAMAITLPPRTLRKCEWPAPDAPESWIFVTENPSVASAAADLATGGASVRLLCTSGTPSADEVAAIARLALRGWRIAVRADFDPAGLAHVAAILGKAPGAIPWRMSARDYARSVQDPETDESLFERIPETRWDLHLAAAMRDKRIPAYEEFLLPVLLDDLRRGAPGHEC